MSHFTYLLNFDFLQALVVIVKKALEVEYLPTLLTGEVIGQSLQLIKHDILNVIIIEKGLSKETVVSRISVRVVVIQGRLVKQSLACRQTDQARLLSKEALSGYIFVFQNDLATNAQALRCHSRGRRVGIYRYGIGFSVSYALYIRYGFQYGDAIAKSIQLAPTI